ncbi:hypothetical protein [Epilithonimonas sp. UC225_85]|uniref:hypothetical protein n=1 Tax=Epilithonimonas sp. UC225_85 TaxID=3350167 RepID=UPI0036D3B089
MNRYNFLIYRILFSLLLILSCQIFAQDKAEVAIQKLDQDFPQEKVYLMLNKDNYAAGDNIWFKAFVFDAYSRSTISTTLFIELLDSNKKLIDKKLIPIYNSESEGNFVLPDDLKENNYYIRAYTTWMNNFSEDFQFIKPIAVYNPSSSEKLVHNTSSDWTASAYPESGTFVDGINTKVAVRLWSKSDLPMSWSGFVINKEKPDTHLSDFKGLDENVGIFSITPQKGKKYQLTVIDDKGKRQTTDLPDVSESGINFQVKSNINTIDYSLKSNNLAENSGYYKLIATIGNKLVYKAKIKKDNNGETFSIPTAQLINSVIQFTLFDEKENVLAQRLCFVQPQKLNIQKPVIENSSFNLQPKSINSFEIKSNTNIPDYMIAIYDASKSVNSENMLSTLWLTGDFIDYINNPSQYFADNRNTDALDALLISERWTRFSWQDIIAGKFPVIKNKPEPYLSYSIRITTNGKPVPNTGVNVMFEGEKAGSKLTTVMTDSNGDINLKNMSFDEPQKIYYQLKADNTDAVIIPKVSFVPLKKELPKTDFILVKRASNEVLSPEASKAVESSRFDKKLNEKITDIEEVKIKAARKETSTEKLNDELSSPMFQSPSETIFDFVNDKLLSSGSPDILLWLEGRVAGLQIKRDGADIDAFIRNKKADVYLDESKTDLEFLRGLSISNIAMIKVVRDDFFGGFGNSNGAILVYTRNNGNTTSDQDPKSITGLKFFTLKGYDKVEDFKNVNYSTTILKSTNDNRSNLYWNPKLKAQPNHPAKVEFYNNDTAKQYRIILIGLDEETGVPVFYDEKSH